jgi:hypothetical protein
MKKYLLINTLALFVFSIGYSQITKDSLLVIIANEVCTEITSNKPEAKTADQLQMELGFSYYAVYPKTPGRS